MDAQTCLKKLQCVGVLNFSTVGLDGTPQARCISAIHYTLLPGIYGSSIFIWV